MPVMRGSSVSFFSHGPAQTRRFGRHMGAITEAGDVLLLHGDLGAGKTHFAQGIAEGLGVQETVRSPTFTLINEYQEGRLPFYHMDLYRLEGDSDIATVGLDEYSSSDGVVVVEWPEKGERWLPEDVLHVTLSYVDDQRRTIYLEAGGEQAEALLRRYKAQAFHVTGS
jgi:tRNA threonylcarbamoyladenosine biosynthesis protein TsaE